MFAALPKVDWAHHPTGASIQDTGSDHRGRHVTVPQQVLDGSNLMAMLQQVKVHTNAERCDSWPDS